MNCQIETIREIAPHKILKRCATHGIAFVADGTVGLGHSAHPNIDASGSVAGMKGRGYWLREDKTVRCHGFIYNVSRVITSDAEDEAALAECRCGGSH